MNKNKKQIRTQATEPKNHSTGTYFKYAFQPLPQKKQTHPIYIWYYSKLLLATFIMLVLFTLNILTKFNINLLTITQKPYLLLVLSSLLQICLGFSLYLNIITNFKQYCPKILIALASLASYIFALSQWSQPQGISFFETSSFILFITVLMLYLENKKMHHTQIIQNLKNLRPQTALKQTGKHFKEVNTDSLNINDIIKVPAGYIIPLDGTIISGTTSVNESSLTGVFKPLLKGRGDTVIGATLNRDCDIIVQIDRDVSTNTLNKIIDSLQNTFGHNLSLYQKVENFTKTIVLLGILAIICTAYYLLYFLMLPVDTATTRLLATLISFSTISILPAVYISSNIFMKKIFDHGIIINKKTLVETLNKLDTLFFDKTGTLTKGNFEYSQSFIELGTNQGTMLSTVFSLERESNHPLSQSMETHPWYQEINKHPVKEFQPHPGLGICGYVQPKSKKEYFAAVGNLRFLKRMQMHISRDMKAKMDDLEIMGETVLLCGYDKQVKGLISFSDTLRPNVRETLKKIKSLKIEPAIITGDSVEDIKHLINRLNIKKVYSRCTPEEKANKINREKNSGKLTGFIGSPGDKISFDKVDASIIIDTGTKIQNYKADIILMNSDFRMIDWLIKQSKRFIHSTYLNMTVSTIYTLILATASVLGAASPTLITTLILVLNLYILRSAKSADIPHPENPALEQAQGVEG